MPSSLPLPTIAELRQAAFDALHGEANQYGDAHTGSLYDHAAGPMAMLFSQQADRDQDLFEDIYFDSAQDWPLTRYAAARWPTIPRILDTFGTGTCTFTRTSGAAGGGPFYRGTRIQVPGGQTPNVYEVSADTTVTGNATSAIIPIQASVTGTGFANTNATQNLSLLDPVYDPLWTPRSLTCADGTAFEDARTYRARVRSTLLQNRNGYVPKCVLACQAVGANYILAFPSNYGLAITDFTNDFGLNAVYVSDANFSSGPILINQCLVALESCRVLGADLWVGGITNTPLAINALITLVDQPAALPLVAIRRACTQALLGYFGPTGGGFTWKAKGLAGAMSISSPYIQTVSFPKTWAPSTVYGLGDIVVPNPLNGQNYQCTTAGTSGLSQPGFPLQSGVTIADGSAVWTCTNYPSTGVFVGGSLQLTDPVLTPAAFPITRPRYTLAPSAIVLRFTGPI